ncbi:D-alanyl-D-alanine carboxypeptidase/D-alanyl-D-alanine-endopeptidase [Calothrix sp. UHCC 0171]|uniref:D-alanyl-D-alanine carboxypeptidase/D-alanyl-D-alanine endopeptidase n=1 Tax=Calothrix sp. UHCC 0171 TaxID=3110245 RepID=UPI002B1FCD3C|nr:D-alanyl-D-alanine carboxypeptidase/D-alanyl-D-alanine-endopeptidase [Calothrix sp. UHCC 0171]MEA5572278.1 D-alanyl-D-alanine carboxypeptidase/D-alanyl-D-alanine-endopeptidase [Calothrix sp. UHCC 0171]
MSTQTRISLLLLLLSTQLGVTPLAATAQTAPTETPIPIAPTQPTQTICPAQLGSSIDAIANRSLFTRVRWGILVKSINSGQTLYSRDANKYFIPASNTKLLTTAAALQQLGGNFRIRTSIYQQEPGVLRVVGRGDPSITDAQLANLAKQLKAKGITQIKKLIADDSYVQGDVVQPSWQWEDLQSDYGAPVGSFIVNENIFTIRLSPQGVGRPLQISWADPNEARIWRILNQSTTIANDKETDLSVTRDLSGNILKIQGQLKANSNPFSVSLPVVDPNYFFLRRFRVALAKEGINLGTTAVATGGSTQNEVAAIQSPPLAEMIKITNVDSNNLFAESVLNMMAVKQMRKPRQASSAVGLEVLKGALTQMGVNTTSYFIVDGSGLSRKNLISPEALVQLLQSMAKSPAASVFRASLPVGGRTGTLRNRFRGTPAEGIVVAKTGTVGGVVSLSGYLNAPNYEPLVFSIIVNQSEQPARVLRQAVDEMVVTMTQLQKC